MNILDIEINKLFISPTNVRKMLNGVKDETNILDLAKDICSEEKSTESTETNGC